MSWTIAFEDQALTSNSSPVSGMDITHHISDPFNPQPSVLQLYMRESFLH